MKIYTALTLAAKGGGPKIGADRRDVGIDVPDLSYGSHRFAEAAAGARFAAEQAVAADRVFVFGLYSAGTVKP